MLDSQRMFKNLKCVRHKCVRYIVCACPQRLCLDRNLFVGIEDMVDQPSKQKFDQALHIFLRIFVQLDQVDALKSGDERSVRIFLCGKPLITDLLHVSFFVGKVGYSIIREFVDDR